MAKQIDGGTKRRNLFSRVSIRNKIRLGFLLLVVILALSSSSTLFSFNTIQVLLNQQIERGDQVTRINQFISLMRAKGLAARDVLLTQDANSMNDYLNYDRQMIQIREVIGQGIYGVPGRSSQEALLRKNTALIAEYDKIVDSVFENIRLGNEFDKAQYERMRNLFAEMVTNAESLIAMIQAERITAIERTSDSMARAEQMNWILLASSLVAAVILASLLGSIISKPLEKMVEFSGRIAAGDLTVADLVNGNDELGRLGQSLTKMKNELTGIIRSVIESSNEVGGFCQELSASSQEVSASIQEVASTTNQFAGSTQDISARSQKMSVFAQEVSSKTADSRELMSRTAEQIKVTGNVIDELTETVNKLGSRSLEIGHIVDMIRSVSEQTNLLALNAAIEAARAGEHGRGFAVVADEVRKLAEQAGQATLQISGLIADIQADTDLAVKRTTDGAKQLKDGTTQLNTVQGGINEMGELMTRLLANIEEVAAATEEMSAGSQQIASATEEQSATVEEIASNSQQLDDLSTNLGALVRRFKIS